MVKCKDSVKVLLGYQWSLILAKVFPMENIWTWAKVNASNGSGDPINVSERCTYFEKELLFNLEK